MTHRAQRFSLPIAAALTAAHLLSNGCGFKIEKVDRNASANMTPRGFDTPQAAFDAVKIAAKEKDFPAMTECVTDETAHTLAGVMLISGAMLKAGGSPSREIDRVLDKHGLDANSLKAVQEKLLTLSTDPTPVATFAEPVEQKRQFVADMFTAMDKLGQRSVVEDLAGELTDLMINGDKASAIIERNEKSNRLDFRKSDVGWQLHIDVQKFTKQPADAAPQNAPPASAESD